MTKIHTHKPTATWWRYCIVSTKLRYVVAIFSGQGCRTPFSIREGSYQDTIHTVCRNLPGTRSTHAVYTL